MDPTACLREIVVGCHDINNRVQHGLDREEIVERLETLANWINKGGFLPQVERIDRDGFVIQHQTR